MPDLVTLKDAAEALSCSPGTVRRLIEEGQLAAVRLGGAPTGHYRIRISDLEHALESWRVPPEPAA